MSAKYAIGIDLGTTNSVLSYASLDAEHPQVEVLPIPQLVSARTTDAQTVLPSFLYLASEQETKSGAYDVAGEKGRSFAVGELARRQAAEVPDRTVAGAKSWLCHSRVDRHATILPWNAPSSIPKISPVTASRRYIEHLISAWKQAFPDAPFQEQEVVLTVPASFDASARELTREAALAAGVAENFVLLEEPQAAVYAWLADFGDRWRRLLGLGDTLLVCDVGGGTTDLSLITVAEHAGELALERIAVGNHLLVGGDNMDLALAHHVAGLFQKEGVTLDPWQSVALWHACRNAKEALLTDDGPDEHPVSLLGRGSKLIGNTVTVNVARKRAAKLLLDGFFPKCEIGDQPQRQRSSGFQEIGLPFESDTGVTRHVAAFLQRQSSDADAPIRPTHLLLNGGVFKAGPIRKRLLEVLGAWSADHPPRMLEGTHDLDHAVSKGGAYYGWSRRRGGVRIRGGTARAYYVGIETSGLAVPGAPRPLHALCVVPMGMEEGTEADVPSSEIGLVVGAPAQFRFFSSSVRKDDRPGDVVRAWSADELCETAPLETTLPADEHRDENYVPVQFESRITELGVFELWCRSAKSDDRWKLEFSVREEPDA